MKLLSAVIIAILATSAAAQTPTAQTPTASVKQLLAQGYRIVGVSPVTGSYALFLASDRDIVVCQIGFDAARSVFATEKCYPLAN